ncbi:glycosyltransferase family 39 protein [Curtobacterium sp. VKM Ac-2922]|uniref:ArnT family glycosyltransferase n=1 Tax=Curtobacterium sp. VKM Ac-2922 TaxID=2929475 RepID=UPI001FB242E6|nr:glycosyltransferase family 39 protein [Curtobacterium sp. VKM Ac-2922]MCJ1712862.1 glycosyltransferase family 39 protein [Curtobacterium sp. VKM Ac-2922]
MNRIDGFRARTPRWTHQPPRERLTLAAIIVLGAVLTSWNLARGGDSEFYAAAARSMSESWPAFFSGAFDPGATVTLDKLAGFAVPQALSIRLFGMSTAALALPQVLEGIVTVWAVSLVGLRWAGSRVGLVAAALAASTPIFVSMFGHPMEDGLLTMALAVALVWWQRAAIAGTWWPLLVSGLFVGIGFQAKMLQAWLVLPALVIGTLVAAGAGRRWRRGLAHAGILVGAAVVASLAWMVVVALLPTGAHPYVDGSTDDDVFAMVFGYNGVDRFLPGLWPGAVGALGAVGHAVGAAAQRFGAGGAHRDLLQLFSARYASQVGWSWPAALTGIGIGAVRSWQRRADREARVAAATLLTVVVWLATAVVVLSVLRLPHTAYVAAVGVQLAVLAAVGWWGAVRCVTAADRRLLAVPVALLVVQGAWWSWLASASSEPLLLGSVAVGLTVVALVAVLVIGLRSGDGVVSGMRGMRGRRVVVGVLVAAVVAGPACFSLQALDAARDGSGGDASVGAVAEQFGGGGFGAGAGRPAFGSGAGRSAFGGSAGASRTGTGGGAGAGRAAFGGQVLPGGRSSLGFGSSAAFTVSAPDVIGGHTRLSADEASLVATAEREGGGKDGSPLFLDDSWRISADVIETTGDQVLTDGGFSGQVPVFTTAQIESMVHSGDTRLLVVSSSSRAQDPVRQAGAALGCTVVHRWGSATSGFGGRGGFGGTGSFALERCD